MGWSIYCVIINVDLTSHLINHILKYVCTSLQWNKTEAPVFPKNTYLIIMQNDKENNRFFPIYDRWDKNVADSMLEQHLSLYRKCNAFDQSTILSPPSPQKKGVHSSKAFISFACNWMKHMYGYSDIHICAIILYLKAPIVVASKRINQAIRVMTKR